MCNECNIPTSATQYSHQGTTIQMLYQFWKKKQDM